MTQADSGQNPPRSARMAKSADDASRQRNVGEMFDRIAPRYALLNHILSFGLDFSWRRKLAKMLDGNRPIEVLDLATGSGDLLISMLRKRANISKAVGLDISEKMLDVCRRNMEKANLAGRAALIQGDAGCTGLGGIALTS